MAEWFVGRKANFNLTWHETYRRLLRTIDGCEPPAPVRVIRRSKPIQQAARRGPRPKRPAEGASTASEWADKDYYIYLGVTAQSGGAALEIAAEIFREAERTGHVGFADVFEPQEMDARLSGFLIPAEYATDGRIPATPPREEEDPDGAFAFYEPPPAPPDHNRPSLPFDRLLAWLSASGGGPWESFVRVAKLLGAARDVPVARSLFRRMVLLGHLDSRSDGAAWSVAPPVLVRSAADPGAAYWCGSRVESLLGTLPTGWQAERGSQPDGIGPSRWSFRTPGPGDPVGMQTCGGNPTWHTPNWGGPVAERLAALLPDLADWQDTLGAVPTVAAPDGIEQWDVRSGGFHEQAAFRVGPDGRCTGPAGLYRLSYGESPRVYSLTAYFDPDAPPGQQLLQGEWYGLRVLSLSRSGKYLKAMWRDHEGGVLSVPQRQRWPLLFERALVLASGMLPWRDPDTNLLHYQGIPEKLAGAVAEHLGVEVEKASEPVVA